METFGKIITYFLVGILAVILGGFVFTQLWGWFVVPVFGLTQLTIVQAIGLTMVTRMATIIQIPDADDIDFTEEMIKVLSYYLTALGIGWVIQLFL